MPAGLPCLVMMISSFSAKRRYFDRSSLISDSAICFITFSMFCKPFVGAGFRDDRQNLYHLSSYIEKDANIITDAQAVLGTREPSKFLDTALAHLGRLMSQMLFNRITHLGSDLRLQIVEVLDGFRGQHNSI